MALPSSGQITLNQVNVELGLSGTAQIGMNDAAVRGLFGIASGEIEMSDGYGKSSEYTLTNEGTINGQSNRQEITVSDYIDAGGTIVVPSGFWVWSDNVATPAMIIDIACTIKNSGKIIGKGGGIGTYPSGGTEGAFEGGPAVKINSGVSGVTIINNSGAYIAGGGGSAYGFTTYFGGYGAGAGGGYGGKVGSGAAYGVGAGGVLNASGADGGRLSTGGTTGAGNSGGGGGAGGGGGSGNASYATAGGGGGRILPGTGGSGSGGFPGGTGGAGGGAGSNGSNGSSNYAAGGGGGWGANGGNTSGGHGGASGGAAIDDSGVTYTLTQNGTVYGAT